MKVKYMDHFQSCGKDSNLLSANHQQREEKGVVP